MISSTRFASYGQSLKRLAGRIVGELSNRGRNRVPNVSDLWIDPWDYREKLEEAVLALADRGMTVSIYNHQLCTLPRSA